MKSGKMLILMGIAGLFLMNSCSQVGAEKDIISVSILPQKYFVEKIAGDKFTVNVLVPAGASPETYEISPGQMRMLAKSRYLFITGHLSFEQAWKDRIQKLNKDLKISDLSRGIDLLETEHRHDDHFHRGIDPHIWISPGTVSIMADNIFETFANSDPENYEYYRTGYELFKEEIFRADSLLGNLFAERTNRAFLIFHPSLGYLARDYDLEQIPLEYEGKSPPPAYIMKIIDIAREKNIKAVLIQKEFNIDNAKSIAREIDGEIIRIDPLAGEWYEEIIRTGQVLHNVFGE